MTAISDLTHSIIVKLEKADEYDTTASDRSTETTRAREKARNLRISAGIDLAEAQKRVYQGEAGQITWTEWCNVNIPARSERTIRRLLKLGNADDPIAEDDNRQEQDAQWQRNHRNNMENRPDNTDVRPVSPHDHVEPNPSHYDYAEPIGNQDTHRNHVENRTDTDFVKPVSRTGSPVEPPPIIENPIMTQVKKLIRQLSFEERGKLLKWVRETGLH